MDMGFSQQRMQIKVYIVSLNHSNLNSISVVSTALKHDGIAYINVVEEQYVQTVQKLAKVDTLPDMEDGICCWLQCLNSKGTTPLN